MKDKRTMTTKKIEAVSTPDVSAVSVNGVSYNVMTGSAAELTLAIEDCLGTLATSSMNAIETERMVREKLAPIVNARFATVTGNDKRWYEYTPGELRKLDKKSLLSKMYRGEFYTPVVARLEKVLSPDTGKPYSNPTVWIKHFMVACRRIDGMAPLAEVSKEKAAKREAWEIVRDDVKDAFDRADGLVAEMTSPSTDLLVSFAPILAKYFDPKNAPPLAKLLIELKAALSDFEA
jgi:hypothetical protein